MAALKILATSRAVERIFRKAELVEGEVVQTAPGRYMVSSASRPDTYHTISQLPGGRLVCSCEGAIYGRTCWHLAAVVRAQTQRIVDVATGEITPQATRPALMQVALT